MELVFFALLHNVNVLGNHAASIFRVEVCGKWEVDIDIGRV
jgi:hypothetical protein